MTHSDESEYSNLIPTDFLQRMGRLVDLPAGQEGSDWREHLTPEELAQHEEELRSVVAAQAYAQTSRIIIASSGLVQQLNQADRDLVEGGGLSLLIR